MKIKELISSMFSQMRTNFYLPVVDHQVYSEEETVIGVWTDKKPLYRMVWKINLPQTDQSSVKIISGYFSDKKPIHISATIGGTDGHTLLQTNYYKSYTAMVENLSVLVYAGDVFLSSTGLCSTNSVWSNQTIVVEAEYTKDADVTSTSKVPFEPLVEYSTDEKFIGYWISGKKLYKKTVVRTNADPFKVSDNIADIVSVTGAIKQINGNFVPYPYSSNDFSAYNNYCTFGYYSAENNNFIPQFGSNRISSLESLALTFEYTKTAD